MFGGLCVVRMGKKRRQRKRWPLYIGKSQALDIERLDFSMIIDDVSLVSLTFNSTFGEGS
jgi:hypothetical protein